MNPEESKAKETPEVVADAWALVYLDVAEKLDAGYDEPARRSSS